MSKYLIRYRDEVTVHPHAPLEFRCEAEMYDDAVEQFYEVHPISHNILDVFREENERRNVAGHIVEPPNRDEWVNWGRKCDG